MARDHAYFRVRKPLPSMVEKSILQPLFAEYCGIGHFLDFPQNTDLVFELIGSVKFGFFSYLALPIVVRKELGLLCDNYSCCKIPFAHFQLERELWVAPPFCNLHNSEIFHQGWVPCLIHTRVRLKMCGKNEYGPPAKLSLMFILQVLSK